MKARVIDFRKGKRTQKCNQILVEVDGVDSRALASKLIGKTAVFKTRSGRKMRGKIMGTHGNNGVVYARFARGLSAEDFKTGVEVLE